MKLHDLEQLVPMSVNAALAAYAIFDQANPSTIHSNAFGKKVPFSGKEISIYQAHRPFGGDKKIDACYVGETEKHVILAFRGTLSDFNYEHFRDFISTVDDWLNDADATPVEFENIEGKVHKGFKKSLERLKHKGCIEDVVKRMKANPNKDLIVTGHSKGGGIVPIASMYLVHVSGIKSERIHPIMFEPARSGNEEFAKGFHTTFPTDTNPGLRYAYQDDIVPHMPPTNDEIPYLRENKELDFALWLENELEGLDHWNYASVGTLNFIDWNDKIKSYTPSQQPEIFKERMTHLMTMFNNNIGQVGCDHSACGQNKCSSKKAYFYKVITGISCINTNEKPKGLWQRIIAFFKKIFGIK